MRASEKLDIADKYIAAVTEELAKHGRRPTKTRVGGLHRDNNRVDCGVSFVPPEWRNERKTSSSGYQYTVPHHEASVWGSDIQAAITKIRSWAEQAD